MGIEQKSLVMDRRTFLRAGATLIGTGASLSLLQACGQGASSSRQQTSGGRRMKNVSLRFNWTVKGEFTPLFVAREKGFYREQKINVALREGKSGTQAAQVVATGNDQFGYIPSIQVIQGINQGMPLITLATCGKATGMCWASWPNIPLTGPKSLEGHKVSISSSSTFFQVWNAFARKFHVDKSKVDVVSPDPSARDGLFLHHQIDIMADIFWANDYVILQQQAAPTKLNVLRMSSLNFDPVGYLLVVNKRFLEKERNLVKGFVEATLKGFQYTIDHPDDATQIMTRLYGKRLGKKVIAGQIRNMLDLLNDKPVLGKSETQPWNHSLTLLKESGVIDKKLPLGHYFTNEFIGG
ncbi:MAG: ABC transporter substrate-binding protein [Rubrobacteraceae bacterium]|uniref:ABC transporter substrate-binding protein n=1 Tax=Rubrobacter naiadicus TaxID=1392641 RepID=UPI00235F8F01|nr:ABC transporter substrate-binding protein [Rubrobacter naiadicus]MBX6765319.1 ABC transporter substrate-binding protein [Rubrobacteraceae bacterium]